VIIVAAVLLDMGLKVTVCSTAVIIVLKKRA
jgi:hypothetical protein